MEYNNLVQTALEAMTKAISFKSKVGAAILTRDGNTFTGFNIETYVHKDYHAEEIALISALKSGYKKNDFIAIAIAYSFEGEYPGCASCRQFLWEFTNPELIVIYYDVSKNKGEAFVLKNLYPYPYPDFKNGDKRSNMENIKIEEPVKLVRETNERVEEPIDQSK
jgi:cytidine deaminase